MGFNSGFKGLTTLSETRRSRGKTEAVSQHLPGATESNYEKIQRRQPYPDRDLNLGTSEKESRVISTRTYVQSPTSGTPDTNTRTSTYFPKI